MTEREISRIVRELGALLLERGETLAVAESCTGGWIAKAITDLPGSSAWFQAGFVTYSNGAKKRLLGVRSRTLEAHGAVSAETAAEMARGALERATADWSLAVTGIAGPGGGTAQKPVGLVCFAWTNAIAQPQTESQLFSGDRRAVRRQAAAYALAGLRKRCRPGASNSSAEGNDDEGEDAKADESDE